MHPKLTREVLTESVVLRLEEGIIPRGDDECWVWNGTRTPRGYGKLSIARGRSAYTHRLSFMLAYDEDIPAGMVIMHECDNPPCCNPNHLKLATFSENSQDREDKGRRPRFIRGRLMDQFPEALDLYEGGMTCQEIADQFGVSQTSVFFWLRSHGVTLRTPGKRTSEEIAKSRKAA